MVSTEAALNTPSEKRAFLRAIFFLAMPIMGRILVDALVASVDVLVLSAVNQSAMAAVGLADNLQFAQSLFTFGLAAGASVLTAQYWGKGDIRVIERMFGIALRYAVMFAGLLAMASMLAPRRIMLIFTPDEALIREGAIYLRVVALGYLFSVFTELYLTVNKSMERVRLAPKVYAVSLVVNLSLNLLFALVFEWGVFGVALATLIARAVECAICLHKAVTNDMFHIRPKDVFRIDKALRADFWYYALPVIADDVVWGMGLTMYAMIIGHLSSDAVAAYSIAGVGRRFATVICFAMSGAASVLIGNALGRGHMRSARVYAGRMIRATLCAAGVGSVVAIAMMPLLLHLAKLSDAAHGYLVMMLWINVIYIWAAAINKTMMCGIFRAGGDTRFGLFCDAIDIWGVMLPICFFCAFEWRLPVMWVVGVMCLDEFLKLPFVIKHYRQLKWLENITRRREVAPHFTQTALKEQA